MFKDRIEAAHQLAQRLQAYQGQNPLVLGIPRGAVPMALHIAHALQGQMDVVLVRKLRAPLQPELAIDFQAVGPFYQHFPQVEDDEVAAMLGKVVGQN
jgi:predicted phosphoribosyltransferase